MQAPIEPVRPPPPLTGRCYRCLRPRARCFCTRITPLTTRTRFALCMHPDEYRHQKSGTGRLCAIALPRSELIIGVDLTHNARLNALLANPTLFPCLLYPSTTAINLSSGTPLPLPPGRELLVIILDGTWCEAQKIRHRSQNLHALPCLSFTPGSPSRFRIKRQPHPQCLSTIEAAYELLGALEATGYEPPIPQRQSLLDILADLVNGQTPHGNFRRAQRRKLSSTR